MKINFRLVGAGLSALGSVALAGLSVVLFTKKDVEVLSDEVVESAGFNPQAEPQNMNMDQE